MDNKNINREELIVAVKAQGIELAEDELMNVTGGDHIYFFPGTEVAFVLDSGDNPGLRTGTTMGSDMEDVYYWIKCHEDDQYYRIHCQHIFRIKLRDKAQ